MYSVGAISARVYDNALMVHVDAQMSAVQGTSADTAPGTAAV